MIEAALWGLLAASSLVVGAELSFVLPVRRLAIGLVMAFGVGALFSAVAYDLVADALETGEHLAVILGLVTGSLVFFAGDWWIDRMGGADRKRMEGSTSAASGEGDDGQPLAIVLGSVLDGIPESLVLGLSLVSGGSISVGLLAGIFVSNLPEGMAASHGLDENGWPRTRIRAMWWLIVVVSAVAAGLGFVVLDDAPVDIGVFVQGFAAGALITMLADSMGPEAFEKSGRLSGLATTAGFIVALAISLGAE